MTVSIQETPEIPGEAAVAYPLGLLTPLHTLSLPTEAGKLLLRHTLTTVGDVVALHPTQLGQTTNLDRRCVAALRVAVEKVCGIPWEEAWLRGREGEPPVSVEPEASPSTKPGETKWAALGRRMDAEKAQRTLATVRGIPARVLGFATSRGITTVGELLALPYAGVSAPRALGPLTLRATLSALSRLARCKSAEHPQDLHQFADLVDFWHKETSLLRRMDREVVRRRSGLYAPAITLQAVGTALGFWRAA